MHSYEDLNDLRLVFLITETGSLSGAAKRLGVNHATIFRRLNQLEQRLGVLLFERSNGKYSATLAGEELAKAGIELEEVAVKALLKVAGRDLRPSGLVHISTTDSIALSILPAIIKRCRETYPEITLSVEIDNQMVNLSKRDTDIAIRPTQVPPEHLIGKRIAPVNFELYAAKHYLQKTRLQNNKYGDLAQHQWIALDDTSSGHRTLEWLKKIRPLTEVGYRTSNFFSVYQACKQGLGLALLPSFLVSANDGLECIQQTVAECSTDLWLLTHPDLRNTTRIKVIFQLLYSELQKTMEVD